LKRTAETAALQNIKREERSCRCSHLKRTAGTAALQNITRDETVPGEQITSEEASNLTTEQKRA
jgi:hypothetical protein